MTKRGEASVIALILLAILGFTLWHGEHNDFQPCRQDCGEIPFAYKAAQQFDQVGPRYALIENQGTNDHPFLYTHNPNIGAYFYIAMHSIGLDNFQNDQIVLAFLFSASFLFLYFSMRKFSSNASLSLSILAVISTTYWGILTFAYNPLRQWSILGLFWVIYFFGRMLHVDGSYRSSLNISPLNFALLTLGSIQVFGVGYDFWLIVGLACGFIGLRWLAETRDWRNFLWAMAVLFCAFAIPLVLRQIQIIAGLGVNFWFHDLVYTIGLKVPSTAAWLKIPPLSEIDTFYQANSIRRWPWAPVPSVKELLHSFKINLNTFALPRWGINTFAIFFAVLAYTLVSMWRRGAALEQRPIDCLLARFWLPSLLGIVVGIQVFAAFGIDMYFQHEFPLVLPFFLIAKGILVWALIRLLLRPSPTGVISGRTVRIIAAGAVIAIAVDTIMVAVNNFRNGYHQNLGWREFVLKNKDSKYLLVWDSWEMHYSDKNIYWNKAYNALPEQGKNFLVAHSRMAMPLMLSLVEKPVFGTLPLEPTQSWRGPGPGDSLTRFDALNRTLKNEPPQLLEDLLGVSPPVTSAMDKQASEGTLQAISAFDRRLLDGVDYVIVQAPESTAFGVTGRQLDWMPALAKSLRWSENRPQKPPVSFTPVEPAAAGPNSVFSFSANFSGRYDHYELKSMDSQPLPASHLRYRCSTPGIWGCKMMHVEGWVVAPKDVQNGPVQWELRGFSGKRSHTVAFFGATVSHELPRDLAALRKPSALHLQASEFASQFPGVPVVASDDSGNGYVIFDVRHLTRPAR